MKNIRTLMMVFVLAIGCTLQAAPMKRQRPAKKPNQAKQFQQKIARMFALADRLEITDEQLLQLREAFRRRRVENHELGRQITEDRRAFRKAMKEGNLELLAELAPRIGKAQGQRVQNNLEFALTIRSIMTPVQWEKIKLMRAQMVVKKLRHAQTKRKMNMMKKLKKVWNHMKPYVMPVPPRGPHGFAPPHRGPAPKGFGPGNQRRMGPKGPFRGHGPSFHGNAIPPRPQQPFRNRNMMRRPMPNCPMQHRPMPHPQDRRPMGPPPRGPRQGAAPQIEKEIEIVQGPVRDEGQAVVEAPTMMQEPEEQQAPMPALEEEEVAMAAADIDETDDEDADAEDAYDYDDEAVGEID